MRSQTTPRARRIQLNDPCPCSSGLKAKKCHGQKTERPQPLIVNAATVDPSQIAIGQWVLWRYEQVGGTFTRVPYQVNGAKASTHNPQTYNTYLAVLAAYQADQGRTYDGIGFVPTEDLGLIFGDLDHCIDKDGVIAKWALDIVTTMATRTERTPSGTGLRFIAKGALPGDRNKKRNIELYAGGRRASDGRITRGRYLTITGVVVNGLSVIETRTDQIITVYRQTFGASGSKHTNPTPDLPSFHSSETDEVIIARLDWPSDDLFATGDWSKYPDLCPSHSEARMRLLNALAFGAGPDPDRIDHVYRRSALYDLDVEHKNKWRRLGDSEIAKVLAGRSLYHGDIVGLNGHHRNGANGHNDNPEDEDAEDKPKPPFVPGVRAIDVRIEPIRWVWRGRVPLRGSTIGQGSPDIGKGVFFADLVARVTTGRPFADGSPPYGPCGVLIMYGEDEASTIIVPRLKAAGADMSYVQFLAVMNKNEQGTEAVLSLPEHFSIVHAALNGLPNPRLIVVDPIGNFLTGKLDTHKSHPVRRLIAQLDNLAQTRDLAVFYIRHLTKESTNTNPLSRGMGSVAWGAAARGVLTFGKHPNNPALRVVTCNKNNWSAKTPKPLVYSFEEVDLGEGTMPDGVKEHVRAPRVKWEDIEIEITGEELLAAENKPTTKVANATDLLLRHLRDKWVLVRTIEAAAAMEHVNKLALFRARGMLGVKTQLVKVKKASAWVWWLPSAVVPDWNP